jgi:hypothetical protein
MIRDEQRALEKLLAGLREDYREALILFERNLGPGLRGDCRRDQRSDRHRDVAARTRTGSAVATLAATD